MSNDLFCTVYFNWKQLFLHKAINPSVDAAVAVFVKGSLELLQQFKPRPLNDTLVAVHCKDTLRHGTCLVHVAELLSWEINKLFAYVYTTQSLYLALP
jgi:hypothetical protein